MRTIPPLLTTFQVPDHEQLVGGFVLAKDRSGSHKIPKTPRQHDARVIARMQRAQRSFLKCLDESFPAARETGMRGSSRMS